MLLSPPSIQSLALIIAGLVITAAAAAAGTPPVNVQLARQGNASLPVVVSPNASEIVGQTAADLADYLGKISGATFERRTGSTDRAIVVGLASDFPELAKDVFDTSKNASKEQYLLRSTSNQLLILGVSDLAVREGVWDLLYRLGYRQFFPTATWEVIPSTPELSVTVNTLQQPDYVYRRIWPTYSTWKENKPLWEEWQTRNRMGMSFKLNTGHAYGNIIHRNQAVFDAHPEYYALNDGERHIAAQAKFCISNPGLRQLVVDFADKFFAENPDADCFSVDPSDGLNWCECDPCALIGTPSDQALMLANDVSELLEKKYPDKYVAMYAYNMHGPPPTKVRARERVIITVATAFIKGGMTFDSIMQGWRAMGVQRFGVREYYSIIHWDKDLPRGPKASGLVPLALSIRKFHGMGAVYMSAESSENFGPAGLGYYIASRVMWNGNEADQVESLVDDFLTRAFEDAKPGMKAFYEVLHGKNQPRFSEHVVAKLYNALDTAAHQATSPAVMARINALTLYVRYLELYRAYLDTPVKDNERLDALGKVIAHSYRMRGTMLVHSLAQYRTGFRDKAARIPPEYSWKLEEDKNPWKSSDPFTQAEYETMRTQGVAQNKLRGFDEVTYSSNLVPASPLKLSEAEATVDVLGRARGEQVYLTWLPQPRQIALSVTSGLTYTNRGPCKIDLEVWDEDDAEFKLVQHEEIPQDSKAYTVVLKPTAAGLHRVVFNDRVSSTTSTWPKGLPVVVEASSVYTRFGIGRDSSYFYVPKGTQVVGLYVPGNTGSLHDADGNEVMDFEKENGYVQVPVSPAQEGRLWSYRNVAGRMQLLTVPPYVTHDPAMLLLPQEVVEADRP